MFITFTLVFFFTGKFPGLPENNLLIISRPTFRKLFAPLRFKTAWFKLNSISLIIISTDLSLQRVTVTRILSRKVCYISEMDSSLSSPGKLKEDLERVNIFIDVFFYM